MLDGWFVSYAFHIQKNRALCIYYKLIWQRWCVDSIKKIGPMKTVHFTNGHFTQVENKVWFKLEHSLADEPVRTQCWWDLRAGPTAQCLQRNKWWLWLLRNSSSHLPPCWSFVWHKGLLLLLSFPGLETFSSIGKVLQTSPYQHISFHVYRLPGVIMVKSIPYTPIRLKMNSTQGLLLVLSASYSSLLIWICLAWSFTSFIQSKVSYITRNGKDAANSRWSPDLSKDFCILICN